MEHQPGLKECSLFLVHYVPDLVRNECLNVGLFLHSPDEKYLGCLFTDDFRRIKRFHPQADLELLRELQEHFEQEIDEQGSDLEGYLRRIQDSYSNLIQLTPPSPCLLRDPQSEIHELFARYVGARASGPPPQNTRLRIKQRLTTAFVRAGIWEHLEQRIPAEQWTKKGDPFTFDYGYRPPQVERRNGGHIRLIHALSLSRDDEMAHVLANTIRYVRQKEPAKLTAVVEGLPAPEDEKANYSQHILLDAEIDLRPLAEVDAYAQGVRGELMV